MSDRFVRGGLPKDLDLWAELNRIVDKWAPVLGLDRWTYYVEFEDSDPDDELAGAYVQPQYLTATFSFDPKRIMTEINSISELEDLIVHELCHALTWELTQAASEAMSLLGDGPVRKLFDHLLSQIEERTTQMVADAVQKAYYSMNNAVLLPGGQPTPGQPPPSPIGYWQCDTGGKWSWGPGPNDSSVKVSAP